MTQEPVKVEAPVQRKKRKARPAPALVQRSAPASQKESITLKKATVWQIVSGVLAILLIISIFTGGFGLGKKTTPPAPANGGNVKNDTGGSGTGTAAGKYFNSDDPIIGPETAKVTIVEFSDFQCPYCAAATGDQAALIAQFRTRDPSWEAPVPKLKELADQGKIRFVFRHFPLSGHQYAQKAAEAAECAKEQGKFWEYHDTLFKNQNALTVPALKGYAGDLGLDQAAFDSCLDEGKKAASVKADLADGSKLGVDGTPAFFVNDKLVSGAQSFSAFEQMIDPIIAG